MKKARRDHIYELIQERNIEVFAEIGVARGLNAKKILNLPSIRKYYGFDIFENATEELKRVDYAKQRPQSMTAVQKTLDAFNKDVTLFPGLTSNTLPQFIQGDYELPQGWFIDGGHSYKTMKKDWEYVSQVLRPGDICIFDEWNVWIPNYQGPQWQVQPVLKNLQSKFKLTVLPYTDDYKDLLSQVVLVEVA